MVTAPAKGNVVAAVADDIRGRGSELREKHELQRREEEEGSAAAATPSGYRFSAVIPPFMLMVEVSPMETPRWSSTDCGEGEGRFELREREYIVGVLHAAANHRRNVSESLRSNLAYSVVKHYFVHVDDTVPQKGSFKFQAQT
ncbi:hypothetical protein PIB30_002694 [Stylosanthes scabra]|uniref:Uncharacterized protein n=1 Tax=Stylosanthes scabra TaxID=79078 RepID=A0ABU6R238_9FABA|nr:hypothetical protein [Stylosanthes scabra]